ncbi:hypothetical protein M422DRAFT_72275 [Sphaerobolus stellatus SS14]|uniref:Uncharacterized protein n=1 Tax=Sphaerobolus stellatus (strain SS14) TaxID=990650 RepID=A0A0C9TT13_SPHS4|nr:hypothetical protein M422DRAFT_72275 [Sphaerobolus stellatus SS14]
MNATIITSPIAFLTSSTSIAIVKGSFSITSTTALITSQTSSRSSSATTSVIVSSIPSPKLGPSLHKGPSKVVLIAVIAGIALLTVMLAMILVLWRRCTTRSKHSNNGQDPSQNQFLSTSISTVQLLQENGADTRDLHWRLEGIERGSGIALHDDLLVNMAWDKKSEMQTPGQDTQAHWMEVLPFEDTEDSLIESESQPTLPPPSSSSLHHDQSIDSTGPSSSEPGSGWESQQEQHDDHTENVIPSPDNSETEQTRDPSNARHSQYSGRTGVTCTTLPQYDDYPPLPPYPPSRNNTVAQGQTVAPRKKGTEAVC